MDSFLNPIISLLEVTNCDFQFFKSSLPAIKQNKTVPYNYQTFRILVKIYQSCYSSTISSKT